MKPTCTLALLAALAGSAFAQGTPAPAAAASAAAPGGTAGGGGADVVQGFKTWRAADCSRCHGAEQQGSVGPSLTEGLKRLTKEQFVDIVTNGRNVRGVMPGYKTNKDVMQHMDALYAYLKGRSDGSIPDAKPKGL